MISSIIAFLVGLLGLGGLNLGAPVAQLQQGGLGTSSVPTNYVLMGLNGNRITAVATSALGIIAGGSGTPGGSDTQIQFNDGGSFGGSILQYSEPNATNAQIQVQDVGTTTDGITFSIYGSNSLSAGYPAGDVYLAGGFNFDSQTYGGFLQLKGGETAGTGDGGSTWLRAGDGNSTGGSGGESLFDGGKGYGAGNKGGDWYVDAGRGEDGANGGNTIIGAGDSEDADSGDVILQGGAGPNPGVVKIDKEKGGIYAILDVASLTVDRTFTFPDASGTLCLTSTCGFATTSANYWSSVGLGFSTTSADVWVAGKGYLTTVDISANTNLAATYPLILTNDTLSTAFGTTTANTFSLAQTFTVAPVFSSILNGVLATNGSGTVIASSTPTASRFFATSTLGASVFPYASSTAITVSGDIFAGTLTLTNDLSVANGGTGVSTLTGVAIGNGTSAFTAGSTQTCTNQFIRAMSASYVATCASINNADWSGTDLSVANGGTGLSTFGGTNHVLYTTAADTLSSEAAFTYTASTDILSLVNLTSSGTATSTRHRFAQSGSIYWDAIVLSNGTFNLSTSTSAYSTVFSIATSGSMSFGPRSLAPYARGFYHFTDHDGTRPCLGWIGNDGGDTDWMACRITNNNSTNDDMFGFGATTASTTEPTSYNIRMRPGGQTGIGSTTPSINWGLSIGTTTLIANAQFSVATASSTTNTAHRIINWESGNTQRIILQQNTTVDINSTSSYPRDGAKYILDFCQDGTGSRTLTWAGSKTPIWQIWGGTSTILATANTMSSFAMTYDGRTGTYTMRAFATSSDVRACVP